MSVSTWFSWPLSGSHARRRQRRNPASRRKKARLFMEHLEDRLVPTNYSAANVSALIADINAANEAGGANTISLTAPTTSPYALTAENNSTNGNNGLPVIAANDNLTIVGNGDTINAAGYGRLFDIVSGASLTLENLTLEGGLASAIGASEGGAIYNLGALSLSGVTVQDNAAFYGTNGSPAYGGGLYLAGGTAALTNTTVSDNTAEGGQGIANYDIGYPGGYAYGGGIYVAGGTATLTNVVLSSNTAVVGIGGPYGSTIGPSGSAFGGGLDVAAGSVMLTNSTLSGNTAQGKVWGGLEGNAFGGGLDAADGTVNMTGVNITENAAVGVKSGGGGIYSGAQPITYLFDKVTATSTTLTVGFAAMFSPGETILIGSELMTVTAVNTISRTLTVVRGVDGTTAASHVTIGTYIYAAQVLASAINATQTTIPVGYAALFAPGDTIIDGSEAMTVTAVNTTNNTLTVVRGAAGTTAASHVQLSSIYAGLELDAFTLANVVDNTADSDPNIDGPYIET